MMNEFQKSCEIIDIWIETLKIKNTHINVLYRYEDIHYTNSIKIELYEYKIIKKTAQGAWVKYSLYNTKFVLLTARNKYACITKKEALELFKFRKKRQIQILTNRLNDAQEALNMIKTEYE